MTPKPAVRRLNSMAAARGLVLVAGCALLGCGQNYSDSKADEALAQRDLTPTQEQANPHAGVQMPAPKAAGGSFADLTMDVPEGWESVPPSSSMRVAEYRIPATHGGGEGANLAVFKGPMGTVEDNVSRWFGQFDGGDGKRREAKSDGGFTITFVDVSGTYNGGMGMGGGEPKADYRMLGAIAEGSLGSYYFKLTGPRVEIDSLEKGFDAMIMSLRGA